MSRTRRADVPFYKKWPSGGYGKITKRRYWKAVRRGDERSESIRRSELNYKGW